MVITQAYLILFIVFIFTSVTSCDSSNTSTENTLISYEMVNFSRKGGKCLGDSSDITVENEHCATIEINYPEIEVTPVADMRDKLNKRIQDNILSSLAEEVDSQDIEQMAYQFIQEFKKETEDLKTNWSFKKDITVLLNTPQIISFQIEDALYTGGAHSDYSVNFINIDLDIMKDVKLDDLLLPSYEAELNLAGEKIFRKSYGLSPEQDLNKAGFSFENNTFVLNDNFGITEKGLLFYFNIYEIAPYAMGTIDILIPYNQIQNLIDSTGPLVQFITHDKFK